MRKSGRIPIGQVSFATPSRQSVSALPLVSDVDLLGNRESIVHLDTKISNGAFDLSVPKKQLHGSQIARATIDQRRFCSTKRMGTEDAWVDPDAGDPVRN
jgi:hypothetical protein